MKDFYSPETERSYQPVTKLPDVKKGKSSIDPLITVRKSCPKCDSQRAYETNRVSITKKKLSSGVFITRYKCVTCEHSWVVYEKGKD